MRLPVVTECENCDVIKALIFNGEGKISLMFQRQAEKTSWIYRYASSELFKNEKLKR